MPQLPPELRVEIRKVGDQFLAVTSRANEKEICSNLFTHEPDKLIHIEPQWMLEKGTRTPDQALRSDVDAAARKPDDQLLVDYGKRLYGYLFGEGAKLHDFFEFNDAYGRQARLTLCLHPDAAALWSLPWEYLHDGIEFLCLTGRLLLNRLPFGLGELSPAEAAPPLRILVVIAAPDDQAELNVERELSVIQDALDDVRRRGLVQVDFLDDATLPALQDALSRQRYHVVHYTGHGSFDADKRRGQLCFEDDVGKTGRVSADDLRPLLVGACDLRLVVLSACQSAKTSGLDAFDSVATGLLQAELPVVLAMQFSILDASAIEMARVLYTQLAQGQTPEQALLQARLALRALDEGRAPDVRRFDWGVPALYVRAPGLRLIDPTRVGQDAILSYTPRDLGGLVLPRIFVGRRKELRALRRALRQRVTAIYLRGIGGIGKSTLAAKLIERPGVPLDSVCVIRCNQLPQPTDALNKLASFLQAQGKAGHAEAAALLIDSRHDPADRARAAMQRVADRRYMIVFDNLESWLETDERQETKDERQPAEIADETMRGILRGLLTAQCRSTFLFTGRFRCAGPDALPAQNRLELHLPELTMRQALLLMNALPRLEQQPLTDKLDAYRRIGGHPKTIELLDGWLAEGRSLHALLDDPTLKDKLAGEWEGYFLSDLLARLTPAERDALTTLAILNEPFWWEMARDLLTSPLSQTGGREGGPGTQRLLSRFLDLSLIQFHAPGTVVPLYTLHPVVKDYLLGKLDQEQLRALHARAAAYYGKPFVDAARQAVAKSGQTATEEEIELLARLDRGVAGAWVRQTRDMQRAHWAMQRALAWQEQLYQAGQAAAANDVVNAVHQVLARWGQRDLTKSLLRRDIETIKGPNRVAAQGNLATLLKDEGRFAEALETFEQVYAAFAALDAKEQMSVALNQQGLVLTNMGDYNRATEKLEASLQIEREAGYEEGQAISLHWLSVVYMNKKDYQTALARSQEAEKLGRKIGDENEIAYSLHQQGLIYNCLGRPTEAFERFRESLEILHRIGNESGAAGSLGEIGKLLAGVGQMREAIVAFNECLEIHQRNGDPMMGIDLQLLGTIHERQGEYAAALEKYEQALHIFQQVGMANEAKITQQLIAQVEGKMGK